MQSSEEVREDPEDDCCTAELDESQEQRDRLEGDTTESHVGSVDRSRILRELGLRNGTG